MIIQSLFNTPHRLKSCVDFAFAHFGNREHYAQRLIDCTRSADGLQQGFHSLQICFMVGLKTILKNKNSFLGGRRSRVEIASCRQDQWKDFRRFIKKCWSACRHYIFNENGGYFLWIYLSTN